MNIASILSILGLVVLAKTSELERGFVISTTNIKQICSTFFGPVYLASIPTTTQPAIQTLVPLAFVTLTPVTTITPLPSTIAITKTKIVTITNPTTTDTFTKTNIATEIISVTNTVILTTISTSTTTTVITATTVIVPTPSGFIYPHPTANARPRMIKMGRHERKERFNPFANSRSKQQPIANFPSRVVCSKAIEVIQPYTITITPTTYKTITAPTATNTLTSIKTTTSTKILANASTTVTQSTTTTITTTFSANFTTTDSLTLTVTQQPPAVTTYAACGQENQISRDSNGGRLALFAIAASLNPVSNTDSAYDCCALCQKTPNCAGSNFISVLSSQGASCQLNLYSTCPAGQSQIAEKYYRMDLGSDIIVSNGLCGQYQFTDGNGLPLTDRA